MWALKNKTPFAAGKAFERDKDGHEFFCLGVKASICPRVDGLWDLHEKQQEVRLAPELGEDEMIADADIVPFIPGAEVTLRGTVEADMPADGRLARLRLGGVQQEARLWPPRQARKRGRRLRVEDLPPAPLPLCWSMALGGPTHMANPVGCGLAFPDDGAPAPLPRILPPSAQPHKPGTEAVGFGPIHRHWSPRIEAAGTYDAEWEKKQAPCLPKDFDPRFYFSAPAALQQTDAFKGGEPLILSGFGPGQDLQIRLPSVVLTAQTDFGTAKIGSRLALRRVEIDLDARCVTLLWLAAVPCDGQDHLIRSGTIYLKQSSGIVL